MLHAQAKDVLTEIINDPDAVSRALTNAFNKGFHAWFNGVTIDYSDTLGYVVHDWRGNELHYRE